MKRLALVCTVLFAACPSESKDNPPAAKPAPEDQTKAEKPPEPPKPAAPDPKVLERGRYLVENVMGCAVCHTPLAQGRPDFARAYAGGLEFPEEFGTWRTPNITQDKKTGIGGWTDEQLLTGIREGKRPDGTTMYPVMPYLLYNMLSDEDGKAVVAFLRTIKPIEHQVAGNDLKMPKIPAPPPKGAAPDDQGLYLATLMHCSMCHTPMGKDFAPDMSKLFAGGFVFRLPPPMGTGVLHSPNLTSDKKTGIGGKYDEAKLIASLKEGKKADGKPIMPPMAFFTASWSGLTDEDVKALAGFILALPPVENKVPKSTFKPAGPPPDPPK